MIYINKIFKSKSYKLSLVAALLLVLSACSIFPKSQPLSVYRIEVPSHINTQALSPVNNSIKVSMPYGSNFINSNRILVRTASGEINAYKGVKWADPAPTMLRNYLIDYFRDSGQIATVVNDAFSISSQFALEIDLRRFESSYLDDGLFVHLELDALLINNTKHKSISTKNFKVKKPSANVDTASVVKQFDIAASELAHEILVWVNQQINLSNNK